MKPLFKLTSCLLLALGLTACATSPTGRSQLLIFSSNQLDQMGAQAFDGMKAETPVSQKPSQNSSKIDPEREQKRLPTRTSTMISKF